MVRAGPCLGFGRGSRLCRAWHLGAAPHVLHTRAGSPWLQDRAQHTEHRSKSSHLVTGAWNSKREGQHSAQWETLELSAICPTAPTPSSEGTRPLPAPTAPQPQAATGFPSLGSPSPASGMWAERHRVLCRALLLLRASDSPRAIPTWVTSSPWGGTEAAAARPEEAACSPARSSGKGRHLSCLLSL